jgi:hypothetical protein
MFSGQKVEHRSSRTASCRESVIYRLLAGNNKNVHPRHLMTGSRSWQALFNAAVPLSALHGVVRGEMTQVGLRAGDSA